MPTKRGRRVAIEKRVGGPVLGVDCPRAFVDLWEQDPKKRKRFYVYYGGRGAAKSHQVAQRALIAGHQARRRILCAREFQTSMRDSVHQLLAHYVERLGLSAFYQVRPDSIIHANGTEFLFKGLRRNIEEVKSTEGIDVCWVEEAQGVSARSWDVLVPTVRRPGSEIWVTFNPYQATDPTWDRFVAHPPPSALVRKVTWRDNPWFPDVLREEMEHRRETDHDGYLHIWEGELWNRSALQILTNWRIEPFEPQAGWAGPYYGLDFGFSIDPLVLVRCWIDGRVLYVEYAHHGRKVQNDDLRRFVEEVPEAVLHNIRADSARPETIAHLNGSEGSPRLRVFGAEKWAGSVEDGISHLQSFAAIVVHPRCDLAVQEFKVWRYEADKLTGEPLRKPHPKDDNVADAVRYAIEPIIKASAQRFRPAILTGGQSGRPAGGMPRRGGMPNLRRR